jgi:hypothetical protein
MSAELSKIPRNQHLSRTLHIKCGGNSGSATIVDFNSKQYLLTAGHVVEPSLYSMSIEIYFFGQWQTFPLSVVAMNSALDVAVLSLPLRVAPK